MQNLINILLLVWSYLPLFALTDELDFSNASLEHKNKWKLRFSCLNIYFGEYLIQLLTFCISEKKLNLYKITKLSNFPNFDMSETKTLDLKKQFFEHMDNLSENELLIEKEALLRQLSDEDERMNLAFNKINMYTTIILGGVPILLTILSGKISLFIQNVFLKLLPQSIVFLLLIYFTGNLIIIILQFITIRGIRKSKFSELKNSDNKEETLNWQIYYDWQIKKRKVNLFISLLKIFQNWFVISLILFLIWLLIA